LIQFQIMIRDLSHEIRVKHLKQEVKPTKDVLKVHTTT